MTGMKSLRVGGLRTDELRFWATLVVGIAYWANVIRGAGTDQELSLRAVAGGIIDNGAFDVFAWALVLGSVFTARNDRPASLGAHIGALVLGVVVLVPVRMAPALALVLLGLLPFGGPQPEASGRQVRLVLFALAAETVWMTSVLAPLHVLVAVFDAHVTAFLLGMAGDAAMQHGNVVDNLATGFSIVIWPYCCSSFPLADVGLAFLVMVVYRGKTLRSSHLPWLALAFAGSIVLTEIRLALMATDAAGYRWWHFGPGLSLYALAALGWSVLVPILATADRDSGALAVAAGRPVA